MNEVPPGQDDADEVDELYRRASALDDSRPNELVRRRVLQHAAQLAAERAAQNSAAGIASTRAAQTWRRPAIFGTLAAAALAGLLIVPQFLNPSAPPPAASPPAMDSLSREAVVTTGAVQEAKQSREDVADEQLRSAAPPQYQAPAAAPPQLPAPALAQTPTSTTTSAQAQVQGALKPHAFARNAAPLAESAAEIAAKNAPAERQKMSNAGSAAAAGDSRETGEVVVDAQRRAQGVTVGATAQSAPPPQPASPMAQSARSSDPAVQLRGAAEIGDVAQMRMLLDKHSPIEARDEDGRTALMLAVLRGQSDAVNALLARGADPNVVDAHGTSPLQAAVAADQQAIIAALRRAGAR